MVKIGFSQFKKDSVHSLLPYHETHASVAEVVGRQRERGLHMKLEELGVPSALSAHLEQHLEQHCIQMLKRASAQW